MRVILVSQPRKRSSASRSCAMARLMPLSTVPSAATAPPSSPPCPASMTITDRSGTPDGRKTGSTPRTNVPHSRSTPKRSSAASTKIFLRRRTINFLTPCNAMRGDFFLFFHGHIVADIGRKEKPCFLFFAAAYTGMSAMLNAKKEETH